jgi:hypothetical protein
MKVSLGTPVAVGPPLTDAPTRFGGITMSDPVRDLIRADGRQPVLRSFHPSEVG